MSAVTADHAERFVAAEDRRPITGKTRNSNISILRSVFKRLGRTAGVLKNPFSEIDDVEVATISRKPLSTAQSERLLAVSRRFPFGGPLVVVALCTALRLKDACLLRQIHVRLEERLIAVKTAKGGSRVWIPIFEPLYEILAQASKNAGTKPDDFIFPLQANMFLSNPDGVAWRVRKVFLAAGFTEGDTEDTGSSLSSSRPGGGRRVSLRSFHALRTTWVTAALMAGVPIEIVKKITGHRIVATVSDHYFQPGTDEVVDILKAKMPAVFTTAKPQPPDQKDGP